MWCEVFLLPLFRNVFLLGPFRACFGFGTLRATLAHVKAVNEAVTMKKHKGKKAAPAVWSKKKKNGKAKAPVIWCLGVLSLTCNTNELLLLTRAFMTVSCNAKQSTDKKANKFWEVISWQFEELVATTNVWMRKIPSLGQSQQTEEWCIYATVDSIAYSQPVRNLLGSLTRTLSILVKSRMMLTWISIMLKWGRSMPHVLIPQEGNAKNIQ